MKVAICYTKRRTDEIMESFTKGVVSSGDHVELIKSKSDLHKLERCDVSFQIAEVTRYESLCYHSDPHGMAEEGYMRVAIKNKMIELGRQRVMLDCGILDDDRNRDPSERYYSIGVDGIKRGANFYNENSPNDRFKKRKLRIKEWRNSTDYYHNLVKRVREYTDRPIVFRTHPIGDKEIRNRIRPPEGVDNIKITDAKQVSIKEDLKNAWCAVTRTSNGAVDAAFNGIPVITEDPICLAYDVAGHTIKKIEDPEKPSRNQWVYDMSYAEWSLEEMRQGLAWNHLRSNLKHAQDK